MTSFHYSLVHGSVSSSCEYQWIHTFCRVSQALQGQLSPALLLRASLHLSTEQSPSTQQSTAAPNSLPLAHVVQQQPVSTTSTNYALFSYLNVLLAGYLWCLKWPQSVFSINSQVTDISTRQFIHKFHNFIHTGQILSHFLLHSTVSGTPVFGRRTDPVLC